MDTTSLAEDLVFDVGLHNGEDSAYYLRKGFRVVAFEANPVLVASARARFAEEISVGRMEIVEGAIDDLGRETVTFFVHPEESVWGTTDETWALRNAPRGGASVTLEVASVDFAQAIRRHGVPYYAKIDIEGADRICLESFEQFRERPRYLSIESEKLDWQALISEFELLERLGYHHFAICQQEGIGGQELAIRTRSGKLVKYRFEPGSSGPFGDDLSEPWLDREAAVRRYVAIFRRYRMFGDRSPLAGSRPTRTLRRLLSEIARRPLPGWYDTHAARAD